MPVLPVHTDRLTLRMMRPDDADALAAYRNDPEIARYQDWKLPYTVDDARSMLDGQAQLDDLPVDDWVQVAIEHEGTVVGDVAVGLIHGGHVAMLGYTLAPEWHGRGFAGEAAEAMVDAIFARTEVHRIVATLDPANFASMRVIEPLGFQLEGTARQSELIRGEWLDDMRFGLLRSDRAAWLARPLDEPATVELVEVVSADLKAVRQVATFEFQRRFVAPMDWNLAQALVPPTYGSHPVRPWYRAVRADGEIVGFIMMSDVTEGEPIPYLWRFIIDRRHQRRRIGERAIAALVDHVRAAGHSSLLVSWVDQPGGPRRFYERLGFVTTGNVDEHGEVEARLDL